MFIFSNPKNLQHKVKYSGCPADKVYFIQRGRIVSTLRSRENLTTRIFKAERFEKKFLETTEFSSKFAVYLFFEDIGSFTEKHYSKTTTNEQYSSACFLIQLFKNKVSENLEKSLSLK